MTSYVTSYVTGTADRSFWCDRLMKDHHLSAAAAAQRALEEAATAAERQKATNYRRLGLIVKDDGVRLRRVAEELPWLTHVIDTNQSFNSLESEALEVLSSLSAREPPPTRKRAADFLLPQLYEYALQDMKMRLFDVRFYSVCLCMLRAGSVQRAHACCR